MPGTGLPRKLGLFDSTSIVVGVVIGTGIFLTPGVVARGLPSEAWILGVWIFAGLYSLVGALCFAELGAAVPATGGQYVFLREAFGPLPAFLCAWSFFLVIWSGTIAALASAFSIHLAHFLPMTPLLSKLAAVALIAALTFLNYRGVRQGASAQNLLTVAKLAGLGIVVGSAFLVRDAAPETPAVSSAFSWTGLALALIACGWTYDGWQALSFVAGEVKRPERNLPRALGLGLALIAAVYVLANVAYLKVLPAASLAATERAGVAVAERTMGPIGATLATVAILVSIAGAANGSILAPSRIYFAQARDRMFFARFGEIHPRFETPWFSLLCQGLWSAVLVITGSFETLLTYTMFANWIFGALTVAGLIVLRNRRPELPRPYRVWGYPVTPIVFVGVSLIFLIQTIAAVPLPSLLGAAIIASGIPAYFLWRHWSGSMAQ